MASSFGTVEGDFKTVYGNEGVVKALISEIMAFNRLFKSKSPVKVGRDFRFPVQLTHSGGVSSSNSASAFQTNTAVQFQIPEAIVTSTAIHHAGTMSYPQITAAANAAKESKHAFADFTKLTMADLVNGGTFHEEIQFRYGCGGSGQALDTAGSMDNLGEVLTSTQASSGVYDLVLTDQSWCSGIWVGREGHYVDIRNVTDGAQITGTTYPTITSVTPATRTIRVTGTEADLANVAVGDHLHWGGPTVTTYENQMIGLVRILQHTTGDLFDVSATTYSGWRGNSISNDDTPLTLSKVSEACQRAANRGASGMEFVALVSPDSWQDVMNDQAALVQHTNGIQSSYAIGAKELKVHTVAGPLTLVSDVLMKRGLAMVVPKASVTRLGAETGSFDPANSGVMLHKTAGYAGVTLEYYKDSAIVMTRPDLGTLITNISPTLSPTG